MLKNHYLKQWMSIVSYHLPELTLPQASGLATWSFGMVMTQSSSLTRVSHFIATLNQEKFNTVRQRLKEWYQEAQAKSGVRRGNKRAELQVSQYFAPLLRWVLNLWPSHVKQLPLAIDATNIGQTFTVLSINVLYRSCAIPVAWKVVRGTEKGAWKPHWQELFESIKPAVSSEWMVIVCADRGLYGDWLYHQIVSQGWHPFLRINHQGTYQLDEQTQWQRLADVVDKPGLSYSAPVTCFKTNPLGCTLLACWQPGYQDPWLIVTDLAPEVGNPLWYGLRSWIECSYRDFKSDGWQWHKTRLRDPLRAERHWLAMAVATLWMVTVGGGADSAPPESLFEQLPQGHIAKQRSRRSDRGRQLSCFLQGLLNVVANLLNGQPIVLGRLFPQSWPSCWPVVSNTS
ncbi:transposase [Microcoleus sp. POL10_C6]|uniref:transposase n=1 Tax=unclassified Microcoleus TaxID=2642155 RepID=UPI002FD49B58